MTLGFDPDLLDALDLLEDDDDDFVFEDDDDDFVFEDDDGWVEAADPFPALRSVLAPEWRGLPADDIESLFASAGLDAEDMEFNLGKAFRDVGRAAASLAPTVLPIAGTALGTAFGGPVGGALGGTLGNLAGGAVAGATRPRSPSRAPARVRPRAAAPRRSPPGAAASLLSVLNRPEVLQALQSLALGPAGASRVPVGGTPVPPAAFANLLGVLAGRAAAEHHAIDSTADGEAVPVYLLDAEGTLAVDPTVPEARADRLLELLDAAAFDG